MRQDSLKIKQCVNPQCKAASREVIYAEKKIRRGWYCQHCGTFDAAIGRERTLLSR